MMPHRDCCGSCAKGEHCESACPAHTGFFVSEDWYWFDAWRNEPAGWRPLYSRGWMRLSSSRALTEFIDTAEAFRGQSDATRYFRYNDGNIVREGVA